MRSISDVLDQAKKAQMVTSDYKLGLTLGIGLSALGNYRSGRSFPDEKTCAILAQAMGEDPALLTVEMQAQRAKTPEARKVWFSIAQRLQMGFANVSLLVSVAIVLIALTSPAARAASDELFSPSGSLYIMLNHKCSQSQ